MGLMTMIITHLRERERENTQQQQQQMYHNKITKDITNKAHAIIN